MVPRTVHKWFKMIDKGIATQLIFRNLAKNNFIETLKKNEDGLTKIDTKSDA
jgi:hypothetical protein